MPDEISTPATTAATASPAPQPAAGPASDAAAEAGPASGQPGTDARTGANAAAKSGGATQAAAPDKTPGPAQNRAPDTQAPENPGQPDPLDQPITDFARVDLGLDADAPIDQSVLAAFGQTATEIGLTPRQAQALAQWQVKLASEARQRMAEQGVQEFKKEFGSQAPQKQKDALEVVTMLDRALGNDRFSQAIAACGADNSPAFVAGLAHLASLIGEDRLAATHGPGAATPQPETPLDGIRDAFKSARARG